MQTTIPETEESQPTQAARVLAKIQDEYHAMMPVPAQIAALLPQLDGVSAIMVQHPEFLFIPSRDLDQGVPYSWLEERPDTHVVLFEDGSLLFFERQGHLAPHALWLGSPVEFDSCFGNHESLRRISATRDILEQHPDEEAWRSSLSANPLGFIRTIYATIEDHYDPPIEPGSLQGEQNYSERDAQDLHDLVMLARDALPIPHRLRISLKSGRSKEEPICLEVSRIADYTHLDEARDLLLRILDQACDLKRFVGYEYECPSGSETRLSSYVRTRCTVIDITDEEDRAISNHTLLGPRSALHARLMDCGLSADAARSLCAANQAEIAGPPIRAVDDEIPF